MSSSIDQLKTRVDELSRRYKAASSKKMGLEGQLQAKKEALVAIKREIEEAGLDPKNLKETKEQLRTEVENLADELDKNLTQVEAALAAIENK